VKISLLLLFILYPLFAFDISGDYSGLYRYYDQNRNSEIGNFTIQIKHNGNKIKGVIKEPRTTFGPNETYLYSDFEGEIIGNENNFEIKLTKQYRYNQNHLVNYHGNYKITNGEVAGEWNIGAYKGDFKIFGINSQEEVDLEAPKILITKPFVELIGNNSMRALKIIKINTLEIEGIVSDNIAIDSVLINGVKAQLKKPSEEEQSMIIGKSMKFFLLLDQNLLTTQYHVEVTDINGNKNAFTFVVDRSNTSNIKTDNIISEKNKNKIAVLIGINTYLYWPGLEFSVNDANAMESYLKKHGYRIIKLLNQEATRANILKTIGYSVPNTVNENDSVLIYFAGHGHTESLIDGNKEGYIIPVDANTEDPFLSAISMQQLKSIVNRTKAKHILFLMDSCYSGMGFTRSAGISKNDNEYIRKVSSYRAVQMITAGGMNEQVLEEKGHGVFTQALLDGLSGKADFDKDGFITGSELGTFIKPEVTRKSNNKQTPNFGRFEGEGEFIFNTQF